MVAVSEHRPRPHPRSTEPWLWGLAAIVLAGAVLRFATLGLQSLWLDEAVTHNLVTRSLTGMLGALPGSESTPPLYYVLAWIWVRVFGAGEVGLRSLSALIGTATIVVLAAIAVRLGGRRAALAAAAVAAFSPLLIWYSQEARAYALLVLMCALSLWFLLREDWRGWAITAALALASHYFAVFVVVPELFWVLRRGGRRARISAAAVVAVAVALLPLAVVQASGNRAAFIASTGLPRRVAQVPKQFLIGYATPHATALTLVAALLALVLALHLRPPDRPLIALAAIAVGVPVALAIFGADYVITRNLLIAMVPLVVLAGIASSRTRVGPGLVAGICGAGLIAYIGVESNNAYQRDDWRGVAAAIGPAQVGPRILVVDPASGGPALELYMPARAIAAASTPALATREIDVIDVGRYPPAPVAAIPVAGFTTTIVHSDAYTLIRYIAPSPVSEGFAQLSSLAVVPGSGPALLIGGSDEGDH
jgi:4-amino-4-deoxy-L-arabinose transferase-like glycosyltransferase